VNPPRFMGAQCKPRTRCDPYRSGGPHTHRRVSTGGDAGQAVVSGHSNQVLPGPSGARGGPWTRRHPHRATSSHTPGQLPTGGKGTFTGRFLVVKSVGSVGALTGPQVHSLLGNCPIVRTVAGSGPSAESAGMCTGLVVPTISGQLQAVVTFAG